MEALSLAQRLDMPRVVAEATTTLAGIDTRQGQVDLGLKALEIPFAQGFGVVQPHPIEALAR